MVTAEIVVICSYMDPAESGVIVLLTLRKSRKSYSLTAQPPEGIFHSYQLIALTFSKNSKKRWKPLSKELHKASEPLILEQ